MRAALVLLCACGVTITGGGNPRNEKPDAAGSGSDIDAAVAPPDARTCTGGDANANDGTTCFVYFTAPLAWADARTACLGIPGADLAIVTAQAQNDLIAGMIGTAADPASTVYLGGTDLVTEGTWLWVDTTPFWLGVANGTAQQTFTNWGPLGAPTQPNNGAGQFEEDCLVIRGDKGASWFDRPCADEGAAASPGAYGYICAYPL